jgi:protoporphyrinogen oxidase
MVDHDVNIAIVGAGLSGLSTSYHLGHPGDAVVFEAKHHYGGHVHSEYRDGFTWDDGPHISFTSNEYIKRLFAESVDDEYEDLDIKAVNYFRGSWIAHPAQTSLWQVPEPLRSRCVQSFLESASRDHAPPRNYEEWLHQAMGPVFADTFPAAYTRKYWTAQPRDMDVDWIGLRVLRPKTADVVEGAKGPLPKSMYYVTTRSARYPSKEGFFSYCHRLADGADIRYGMRLAGVDLRRRQLRFEDGTTVAYRQLVSTIPLPALIAASADVPDDVREAAARLRSTHFYRIDVAVNHPARREELWYYIYDEDKLSVRLSVTERFAASNAPVGKTGIQVEVYGSAFKPLPSDPEQVKARVVGELVEMGLVDSLAAVESVRCTFVPTGQILYDLERREVLRRVNDFLDRHGVLRVGRYAEWKYLMTDACVLGGRRAARQLRGQDDDADWTGVAITDDDVPEPEPARAADPSAVR